MAKTNRNAHARKNQSRGHFTSPALDHIAFSEQYAFDRAFLPPGILDSSTAFERNIDFPEYLKSTGCSRAERAIWKLYQCARLITNKQYRLHAMISLMAIRTAFEVENAPPEEEVNAENAAICQANRPPLDAAAIRRAAVAGL